jgi:hypothetical protein
MAEMTQKQRFMDTLAGDGADRFPYFDLGPDDEALSRWRKEGLPAGTSVAEFFHLETHHTVGPVLRSYPFFHKASRLLSDPASFARYYDPDEPTRYADNFVKRAVQHSREGRVLYVDATGGGLLQMLGVGDWKSLVTACYTMVDRPEYVEDLLNKTTDFYCVCLERVLSKVKVDYAALYEPIATNHGPVVSPDMFERFSMPGYRKVLDLLKDFNIPLRFFCTTGGDLSALLPPLIEAGINGLWISNIQSPGMEYAALRRTYGPDMALIGGIDSAVLGLSESHMRRAVETAITPLLKQGRYLPCLNDRPRHNVHFAQYRIFRRILEETATPVKKGDP